MEELFVLVVGAGALALMPLVPALRPAVKTVVKGGMAFMNASKMATVMAGEQWRSIVKEAEEELRGDQQASEAATAIKIETEQPPSEAAAPAAEG